MNLAARHLRSQTRSTNDARAHHELRLARGRHALAPEEGEAHQDDGHPSAQVARRPLRAGVRRRHRGDDASCFSVAIAYTRDRHLHQRKLATIRDRGGVPRGLTSEHLARARVRRNHVAHAWWFPRSTARRRVPSAHAGVAQRAAAAFAGGAGCRRVAAALSLLRD